MVKPHLAEGRPVANLQTNVTTINRRPHRKVRKLTEAKLVLILSELIIGF